MLVELEYRDSELIHEDRTTSSMVVKRTFDG